MRRGVLVAAIALALAACQARPTTPPDPGAFRLGAAADRGAVVVRVHAPALAARRARRLLATVADIHHLTITAGPAGGLRSATISAAALAAGTATARLDDLAPGATTVTITAYDAAGVVIGQDRRPATITAGGTAQVASVLRLRPDVATTRTLDRTPLNAPPGYRYVEGVLARELVHRHTFNPGEGGHSDFDADPTGAIWLTWGATEVGPDDVAFPLVRLTTTGAVEPLTAETPETYGQFRRQRGSGRMYAVYGDDYELHVFEPDGSLIVRTPGGYGPAYWINDLTPGTGDTCFYTDGNSGHRLLYALRPGGAPAAISDGALFPMSISADGTGGLVYVEQADDPWLLRTSWWLVRVRADGSIVYRQQLYDGDYFGVPFYYPQAAEYDVLVDANDVAWLTTPDRLHLLRFAPDGTRMPEVTLPHAVERFYLDAAGSMWSWPLEHGLVTRFDADARPVATYYSSYLRYVYGFAATADGYLWYDDGFGSIALFQVPDP